MTHKLMILGIVLIISGCGIDKPVIYNPNQLNMPQPKEKGDAKVSVFLSQENTTVSQRAGYDHSFGTQFSYAVSNRIVLLAGVDHFEFLRSPEYFYRTKADLGGGYYSAFGKHKQWRFDITAGGSLGIARTNNITSNKDTSYTITTKGYYPGWFWQADFGWQTKYLFFGVGMRVRYMDMSTMHADIYWTDKQNKTGQFTAKGFYRSLPEPGLTIGIGIKNIKLYLSTGYSDIYWLDNSDGLGSVYTTIGLVSSFNTMLLKPQKK